MKKNLTGLLRISKANEPMSAHTMIAVGGVADFYIQVRSSDELIKAVEAARAVNIPYRVMGSGSNVIFSDSGFRGLIINNRSQSLNIDGQTGRVIVESGVSLSRLILEAASVGLGGLEPLYGIPGTVGGAIVNNAGAHGVSVSQYLKSSTILISPEKMIHLPNKWFNFGYRKSKLKNLKVKNSPVILNAIFQFQRRKREDALEDVAKYKSWRQLHQPIGEITCGSIFRNPANTDKTDEPQIKEKTAGYLLEQSGAKKFHIDGIRVSRKHANWIVNSGRATAREVRMLIEMMRKAVEDNFGVTLREEIEYLGNWEESGGDEKDKS